MFRFPVPDLILKDIYELKPQNLKEMGISLLLLDLDNTLAKYSAVYPSVRLRNWIDGLKKAGIEPFIFSNTRSQRAKGFADALSVGYIDRAGKPKTKLLSETLKKKGARPENTAIVGDQVYTDVLCGVRAGIKTIVVVPINMTANHFHLLRYGAELPFRYEYL
ncbi:MAG: YqeG family HAD IIIA-type phosphatase [Clostridiales bacterium]|nr:YqeG family HAD IIIA-type phosphatase [Clostridiales bacterium]